MEKIVCKKCKKEIEQEEYIRNLKVCPYCNFHDYMSASERLQITVDEGSFKEFAGEINSVDSLNFYDLKAYKDRLTEAKLKSGLNEAIVTVKPSWQEIRYPSVLWILILWAAAWEVLLGSA